ncbi:hypothetical protein KSMBR1_3687 [Candidatus Kuenenia stuttgartiensis]|uniref:Uncharacterized protein n=1 Tax=Kuenenia stuttgartiensis TaxID=174633 RepID=A0A2C9CIF0_KUEST|nr:hypothetical protein KSMBR1_1959 [Candidatus Kuenenia stuttgartiensis]SOH05554.1 hypothetical protein KSMBR1_3076 [Candidatus Kuenenia stuttgartiensis]SOH05679.1 hypothetical protein KSMBR1_3202 [Candidatus Kuenenia stuttgartiensis]SOH06160.1 hypothetical protein KSMBR1_3687 [Candidatus Kuenenia stuttgartiensis]
MQYKYSIIQCIHNFLDKKSRNPIQIIGLQLDVFVLHLIS